jgi:small subunit ribosomal protein S21
MLIIKVVKGNIEKSLREFKSKVIKTRLMNDINSRKEFEKPSVRRRREKKNGEYKQKKKGGE